MNVEELIARWKDTEASERANKDSFLKDLCRALQVPEPDGKTGDPSRDAYVFEATAVLLNEHGKTTSGSMDLYKRGCFVLEAKQGSNKGKKVGTARRATPGWNVAMTDAAGQAFGYCKGLDEPPPFVIVADIGFCFDLYASFDGTGAYRAFPNAQKNRLFLRDLEQHVATLRAIWVDPHSLNPRRHAERVTRHVAERLGELAIDLEGERHAPQLVAKFLMRCLFTMFAEDIGLLRDQIFTTALERHWMPDPPSFKEGVEALWDAMNAGKRFFLLGKLLRFNGGLFADPVALPLSTKQLYLLHQAALCNWADVEPAVFGTLIERALDPTERHRLGAHFTPRAFVERVIVPTIEEPLRKDWEEVRARVRELVPPNLAAKPSDIKKAQDVVRAFHTTLCGLRVLDPACGSANFLYVALDLFKRLESEVLATLYDLGVSQGELGAETLVTPKQFLGIEVRQWSKEIAELVLWIGYLQWHHRTYGGTKSPPEPVLRDDRNIECRDALLAYDAAEVVKGPKGKPVTRWDGVTTKTSPLTGEEVPDLTAQIPVYNYTNPREAVWPEADFIVGNPPFLGNSRMRAELGTGYTDALRATHADVPDSADFVMYWWNHAAKLVREGKVRRAGLITTTSLTQTFNRRVVARHLDDEDTPASLVFAIADHPWTSAKYDQQVKGGAEVRTAMTVLARGDLTGQRGRVTREYRDDEGEIRVELEFTEGAIHEDLTVGADVAGATPLLANAGLSCPGVKLHGAGFIVTRAEAAKLGLGKVAGLERHIVPYLNGQDIAAKSRDAMVIDLCGLTEDEVRMRFPAVYQHIVERVKPERLENNRATYRNNWWLFGEPRKDFRPALANLSRYIATIESARRRYFVFLDASVLPDNMLVAIASDDAYVLGVLSSRVHSAWALASGGRLGVRHDPRYNKTRCFEPFPFPVVSDAKRKRIAALAEQLDAHRKRQQDANPKLTLTKLYKALDMVVREVPLTPKDKEVWDQGLGSTLRAIHEDIDAAVLDAYGWPTDIENADLLERLVTLNAERRAEESDEGGNVVRWLRPEFQSTLDVAGLADDKVEDEPVAAVKQWPTIRSTRPPTEPVRTTARRPKGEPVKSKPYVMHEPELLKVAERTRSKPPPR